MKTKHTPTPCWTIEHGPTGLFLCREGVSFAKVFNGIQATNHLHDAERLVNSANLYDKAHARYRGAKLDALKAAGVEL